MYSTPRLAAKVDDHQRHIKLCCAQSGISCTAPPSPPQGAFVSTVQPRPLAETATRTCKSSLLRDGRTACCMSTTSAVYGQSWCRVVSVDGPELGCRSPVRWQTIPRTQIYHYQVLPRISSNVSPRPLRVSSGTPLSSPFCSPTTGMRLASCVIMRLARQQQPLPSPQASRSDPHRPITAHRAWAPVRISTITGAVQVLPQPMVQTPAGQILMPYGRP